MESEELVFMGDAVKALGDGKVAGYLCRYGTPKDTDLEGDFFNSGTDYGVADGSTLPVYYQHGFDGVLKNRRIGRGIVKFDDIGVWLEAQLEMRDEYEKMIYELAEKGKLGWSSGAASHLVERESVGKAWFIKSWPIAEGSLTPTPAEPRNSAIPVKSLFIPDEAPSGDKADEISVDKPMEVVKEGNPMTDEIVAPKLELSKDELGEMIGNAAAEAVKKYADSQPEVKGGFEVIEDEADRALKGNPFKGGEFWMKVMQAGQHGGEIDKRLLPLKATGLNEAIPSQGGFLVPPEYSSKIQEKMYNVGQILSYFQPTPISGNNMVFPVVSETSRADGSRWGGVTGYWMAEGGTKTASKPSFETVDIKLNKVAALVVATDELLQDASALQSWILNRCPDELRFKVEAAIMKGDGVGKPLGITNSGALISATRVDASQVDSVDVGNLWARRWQGSNDYVWLVAPNVIPQLLQMTIGNMPAYMPPGGLSQAPYGTLLGRPVIENEYSPSLGTAGDIMLISPSAYQTIGKASGVEVASSIHVYFTADETAFRFVYRFGGQPLWRTTLTPFSSSDTVSPFVTLSASS
jgi:HK97 family phage major capsid protein